MATIVLSHRTAFQLFHSGVDFSRAKRFPDRTALLSVQSPSVQDQTRAMSVLSRYGVAKADPLHVMVARPGDRRVRTGLICHVCSCALPAKSTLALGDGVFVVSPELCFLQAAQFLTTNELVEFGYELCGAYELLGDGADYIERKAVSSVEDIGCLLRAMGGEPGVARAAWALRHVRNGARSPLEAAFTMMLILPRNEGGFGLRDIEMDWRVDVSKRARALTRRTHFYFDVYVRRARLDIEYDGFLHEEEEQKAIDEERRSALDAMKYGMITVGRASFFHKEPFARVMDRIRRKVGIRACRLPEDFDTKREQLRKFVLRRWPGASV